MQTKLSAEFQLASTFSMNRSHMLPMCTFSRCLLLVLLVLMPTTASIGQTYQSQSQWQRYQHPSYRPYRSQNQFHQPQLIRRQPGLILRQPGLIHGQPKPIQLQPKLILPQPKPIQPQPKPIQGQPSPLKKPALKVPALKVPPGSTTKVLSDGRIAIITPFTKEQKREIKKREDERLRLRAKRTQEQAKKGTSSSLFPRLPGEFEKPKAILLSICDWKPHNFDVLIELLEKTRRRAGLILLYNDENNDTEESQFHELISRLQATGKEYPHIRFLRSNLDTIWLRDFGPRFAETEDGKAMVMDYFYDTMRPRDDQFPKKWAGKTNASHNLVPWSLQGGNLLANGRGLAVTTSRLYEDNRIDRPGKDYFQNEAYVKEQLMDFCNIKELVVLKPLEHEATRHVDMFATFLARDLILVAKLDPRLDPLNAKILDDNAKQLSQTKVDGKPLRVERIWIPARRDKHWSTYTNIILTDRLVLIPTCKSDPSAYVKRAVKTYRRLLPKHHIATIDMTAMNKLGGSLHCLSCSIPSFAKFPRGMQKFREAATKPVGKSKIE